MRELIANNNHLYLPILIKWRDALHAATEEAGDCSMQLYVEWTGISGWHEGSSIPSHYDNNRNYLKQRDYSAVIYLNDQGKEFEGGTFYFADPSGEGPDQPVVPLAGKAVIFSSGPENTHYVTEITRGVRYTFTLWLTFDPTFNEDPSILRFLPFYFPTSSLPATTSTTPAETAIEESAKEIAAKEEAMKEGYADEPSRDLSLEGATAEPPWDLAEEKMRSFGLKVYVGDHPRIQHSLVSGTTGASQLLTCEGVLLPYVFTNEREALEVASFYHMSQRPREKQPPPAGQVNEVETRKTKKRKRAEVVTQELLLPGSPLPRFLSSLVSEVEEGEERYGGFYRVIGEWQRYRFGLQLDYIRSVPKWQDLGMLFDCLSTS